MENPIIVILGPTASGKTRLAAHLAYELETEIISGDSRQVFKGMDIGTGKDYEEYTVHGKTIPTHLIDIVEAGQDFHLTAFMENFYRSYDAVRAKNKIPILCGGSGLYIEAVLKGFDFAFIPVNHERRKVLEKQPRRELEQYFMLLPETAYTQAADISTSKRLVRAIEISEYLLHETHDHRNLPVLSPVVFGLNPALEGRRKNIEARLVQRLEGGLIEEVNSLLQHVASEKLIRYGLEYKFVTLYLDGKLSKEEMVTQLTIAIQQFAKRQMTYFRKMEKGGIKINWLNPDQTLDERLGFIRQKLREELG